MNRVFFHALLERCLILPFSFFNGESPHESMHESFNAFGIYGFYVQLISMFSNNAFFNILCSLPGNCNFLELCRAQLERVAHDEVCAFLIELLDNALKRNIPWRPRSKTSRNSYGHDRLEEFLPLQMLAQRRSYPFRAFMLRVNHDAVHRMKQDAFIRDIPIEIEKEPTPSQFFKLAEICRKNRAGAYNSAVGCVFSVADDVHMAARVVVKSFGKNGEGQRC